MRTLNDIQQILPRFIWTGTTFSCSKLIFPILYDVCVCGNWILIFKHRLLGFRRAFPVTGRTLNMTSEIYNIADDKLRKTFFTSLQPYSNMCFYGTCRRYCDKHHPVCGQNGLIEVSNFKIREQFVILSQFLIDFQASFIAYFPVYLGVQNDVSNKCSAFYCNYLNYSNFFYFHTFTAYNASMAKIIQPPI